MVGKRKRANLHEEEFNYDVDDCDEDEDDDNDDWKTVARVGYESDSEDEWSDVTSRPRKRRKNKQRGLCLSIVLFC